MFKIILKSIRNRFRIILLIYISLTLSVFLFLGVQRAATISRQSFSRTITGTDLIVGARTGQLNLILYSVFHMGNAVNNIGYDSYWEIAKSEKIAWAVPVSLGDSHKGFRVVGTSEEYFTRYRYGSNESIEFKKGSDFTGSPFDTVIGAGVAGSLGYQLGDSLVVSHGTGKVTLSSHDNLPFRVQGILEPTGTPLDNALFIPLEGMTAIHVGWENGMAVREPTEEEILLRDLTPSTVTAVYIGLKDRTSAFRVQREINTYKKEPLMAILPGASLYELWKIVGTAEKTLTFISAFVVFIGLISLLTSQLAILEQRAREMALLRSQGATPFNLFQILFFESVLISFAGCLSGFLLLYLVQTLIQPILTVKGFYAEFTLPTARETALLGITLTASLINGIIPAFSAYRQSLIEGMSIRS